jgi:hypothetical protein
MLLNIQHTGVLGAKKMLYALFLPPAGLREFALGIHSCHCLSFGTASINHSGLDLVSGQYYKCGFLILGASGARAGPGFPGIR